MSEPILLLHYTIVSLGIFCGFRFQWMLSTLKIIEKFSTKKKSNCLVWAELKKKKKKIPTVSLRELVD